MQFYVAKYEEKINSHINIISFLINNNINNNSFNHKNNKNNKENYKKDHKFIYRSSAYIHRLGIIFFFKHRFTKCMRVCFISSLFFLQKINNLVNIKKNCLFVFLFSRKI